MDYSKLIQASQPATQETKTEKKSPLGLDFLNTLEEAERIDCEIPWPVTFTFNFRRVGGKVVGIDNPRFYTSSLKGASFEVCPYFDAGTMLSAKRGETGKLVVNCAAQESMFEVTENEEGHKAIRFKATPRFVSFNGKGATRYTDAENEGIDALKLLTALKSAAGQTGEKAQA